MYSEVVFPYTCLQTQPQPSSMSAQAICDVAAWHALIQQVVVEKIQYEVHGGFSCGSAFLPCTLLRTSLRRGTHWVKPTWHAVRRSVSTCAVTIQRAKGCSMCGKCRGKHGGNERSLLT